MSHGADCDRCGRLYFNCICNKGDKVNEPIKNGVKVWLEEYNAFHNSDMYLVGNAAVFVLSKPIFTPEVGKAAADVIIESLQGCVFRKYDEWPTVVIKLTNLIFNDRARETLGEANLKLLQQAVA